MAQFFTFDGPYDPLRDTPRSYDPYGYDPLFDTPMASPPPIEEPGDPFGVLGRRSQPTDENIFDEAQRGLGPSDTDRMLDYYQRRDKDAVSAREGCMAITNNDLMRETCLKGLR